MIWRPFTMDDSSKFCRNSTLLPEDLLHCILEKLMAEISDYVRFAGVCRDWRHTAHTFEAVSHRRRRFFPVLLVPTNDNSETHRDWYSVVHDRTVNSRLYVPYNKRCCGSSYGWVAFAEENLALTLFNPFSGASIHLPPVTRVPTEKELRGPGYKYYTPEYEIQKVVLSADPVASPGTYEVVAIYTNDGKLALFRSQETTWIHPRPREANVRYVRYAFRDAVYCRGKFYAITEELLVSLEVCSIKNRPSKRYLSWKDIARKEFQVGAEKSYLVESPSGHVLWIDRYYMPIEFHSDDDGDNDDYVTGYFEINKRVYKYDSSVCLLTLRFKVYEANEKEGKVGHITELKRLDGQALFLGHNHSELIVTSDFPGSKDNRIYYMDDCINRNAGPYRPYGPIDVGVYSLEDQCAEPLWVADPLMKRMLPPIWIIPKANPISARPAAHSD